MKKGLHKITDTFSVLTFFVAILFFVNCYMYLFRYHSGYIYTNAFNYNELNFPAENYHIQNLENLPNDSLRIIIEPNTPVCDWLIKDINGSYREHSVKHPTIKLHSGKRLYGIKAYGEVGLDSVSIEIEYTPHNRSTFISFCNLPLIEYNLYPVAFWTKLPKNISMQEVSDVKKILSDRIGISNNSSTLEKIIKIGKYLIHKLSPAAGNPSDTIKQLTPLMQYFLACAKKDHVDCANYTDIYFLFADCAGIPTRRIGVAGKIGNVVTSGHAFDESYIKEQKRWAFVDLTSKKLMVLNDTREVLNTIDVLNLTSSKTFEGIKAVIVDSLNRIDSVPYEQVKIFETEYFKPTAKFFYVNDDINDKMGFMDSFREYLGEKSHYGIYYSGTLKIDNSRHYLKLFVFKTFVAAFIIWLIVCICRVYRFLKANRGEK